MALPMTRLLIAVFVLVSMSSPVFSAHLKPWEMYERLEIASKANDAGDFSTALQELRPLSEDGFAPAQYLLGWMYRNGTGVLQDYEAALQLFRLGSAQEDALAQVSLGSMYKEGIGVTQDYVLAHMWYNIASSLGEERGKYAREAVAEMMSHSDISAAQRLARECLDKSYKGC